MATCQPQTNNYLAVDRNSGKLQRFIAYFWMSKRVKNVLRMISDYSTATIIDRRLLTQSNYDARNMLYFPLFRGVYFPLFRVPPLYPAYVIVPETVAIFFVLARLPCSPNNVQPIPLCIVVGCTMHVVPGTCRALVYLNIVA